MKRKECIGYPFQVPWGKHNPLDFRGRNVVEQLAHFNISEVLPVAVVKDPLTWARSMCPPAERHRNTSVGLCYGLQDDGHRRKNHRNRSLSRRTRSTPAGRVAYAAHFRKNPKCCPSPLDLRRLAVHGGAVRNFTVGYKKHDRRSYANLVEMWNEWYRAYADTPLPRLIVRYEDLLFEPRDTVRRICACVGGQLKLDFDPFADAAKFGAGHGGSAGTSRASAISRYGSEATRYDLLDAKDLAFYERTADAGLVARFRYGVDDARRLAAAPDADASRARRGCGVL